MFAYAKGGSTLVSAQMVVVYIILACTATGLFAQDLRFADSAKRIYIANDDHTDFMWTADADTYAQAFIDMLDYHLQLADETQHNPWPYRNRFNVDGNYWLWVYEREKTPTEFSALIQRVRDGTISVPLNALVSCYGGQPTEAVLRGMYYAGRLERKHQLRFPLATAMENQTLPLGLSSLFAGVGAKYSWRGVCSCATRIPADTLAKRNREMYWYTGHDGQRILMKWYSRIDGVHGYRGIGGYWEAGDPAAAIQVVDSDPGFLERYVNPTTGDPFRVIGIFGFGGDDLARKTGVTPPPTVPGVPGLHEQVSSPYCDHFHVIAERESNASRQIIVSNELDFFEDFESHYGQSVESHTHTFGNEWDLYSASMSETSARVRRAVEKLRAAELMATLVSLQVPEFMQRHVAARDRAFMDLGLFWEHNWTADGPISRQQRAAWQNMLASQIEYYVDSIHAEAAIRLAGMIERPAKASRFFVLNPLSWDRTQHADLAYTGPRNVHVVDLTTGEEAPFQFHELQGKHYLRVWAQNVPSAGYKVFEIREGLGRRAWSAGPQATINRNGNIVLENSRLRVTLCNDGAIKSLFEKSSGKEHIATIGGLRANDIAANTDRGEGSPVIQAGPVSATVFIRSNEGVAHSTAVTLYRDSSRIDIDNEIHENFSDVRHWSFSFAIADPTVRTEELGTININQLESAGGDYADTHARYDYITVNHFADMANADSGITLSNADLAFARLGESTPRMLDSQTPQINMLAGGQVDGSSLGIVAQNGATHFVQRFALQPHAGYDGTSAMKFALGHQNPFVTAEVISEDSSTYPGTEYSFINIDDPQVLLWALKPSEEGIENGVIARVWNLAAQESVAQITLAEKLTGAERTTHIETPLESLRITGGELNARIPAGRIETYLLKSNGALTPPE